MGDQQARAQSNGGIVERNPIDRNPNPSMIARDQWNRAEDRTIEIMCLIQPTAVSEMRRKAVIDYIQRLIRVCLGALVFPFGSVPLRTYLPDGDIDLTAFSISQSVEDALANDVRLVLEGEEQNKASEFEVKDVQYIHAEVKLVKCLVQNIVVDISVNQLGGLCTLCFLEQVDHMIAKEHLFKRSITLIKAWCYYESRILGAHHGLISTYALETLVLYIFQHFHSSLNGPLEVLYMFLDYFSKFDWDYYCVSLNGPVPLSALPEMAVEAVENDVCDLLLSKELLKSCTEIYSVPAKMSETPRSFPLKHLNIVDPLKENNNLGRSVSRGNFYRIRSAFTYGARKLGQILLYSEADIGEELTKFFVNTLDRHGTGQRPDVQDPCPGFGQASFGLPARDATSNPDAEGHEEDRRFSKAVSLDGSSAAAEPVNESRDLDAATLKIQEDHHGPDLRGGSKFFNVQNVSQSSLSIGYNTLVPEEQTTVAGTHLLGDAKDAVSSMFFAQTSRKDANIESGLEPSTSSSGRIFEVPRFQFSRSNTFPGQLRVADDPSEVCTSTMPEKKVSSWLCASQDQAHLFSEDAEGSISATNDAFHLLGSNKSPDGSLFHASGSYLVSSVSYGPTGTVPRTGSGISDAGIGVGASVGFQPVGHLSDLTGDFVSHMQSLEYGRWCYESTLLGPVLPFPTVPGSYLQNRQSYDGIYQPSLPKHMYRYLPANGMMPGPPFSPVGSYYHMNPSMISGGFGPEDMPKPRGTGTYFPNMNQRVYRERQSVGRGKHHATPSHSTSQRPRNNGQGVMAVIEYTASGHRGTDTRLECSSSESPRQEFLKPSVPASGGSDSTSWPKLGSSMAEPVHPFRGGHGKMMAAAELLNSRPIISPPSANGLSPSTECLEFGSLGSLPWSSLQRPERRQQEPDPVHTPASVPSPPTSSVQRPVHGVNKEKSSQSYHLKDEDFPPLSVRRNFSIGIN